MRKQVKNKRKKIFSEDFEIGTSSWKYARMLEERRGHNYQHLNDQSILDLEAKGYRFWEFKDRFGSIITTMSETEAQEVVHILRKKHFYARIVTGMDCNMQRIRMYSVIYKQKTAIQKDAII